MKGGKQGRLRIDEVEGRLEQSLAKDPGVLAANVTGVLTILFQAATLILERDGQPGWLATLPQAQDMTAEQRAALETQLQPLVNGLLRIRDGTMTQAGGGPDDVFEAIHSFFETADEKAAKFAKEYGIVEYQREAIEKPDLKPFAGFQFIPWIGIAISEIPVTVEFTMLMAYASLEFLRTLTVVFGDAPRFRQVMSLLLGTIDIMNADWKGALLSLAGLLGPTGVYMGSLTKMMLAVFRWMPEAQQEAAVWTTYTSMKAILIGAGIRLFQLTAPLAVRLQVIEAFKGIADQKFETDQALVQAGLPKREAWYEPNWSNLNRVVTVVSDPTRVCTDEFIDKVAGPASKSWFLSFALQMALIPTSKAARDHVCVPLNKMMLKLGAGTMADYLAITGLDKVLKDDLKEVGPSAAPVAASEEAPASEKTPPTSEEVPASEKTPPASEQTVAASEQTVAASEQTVAASEQTVAASEQTVAASEQAPTTSEKTPPASEKTPPVSEEAAVPEKAPATPEKTPDIPEEVPATPEKTSAVPEKTSAVPEKTPATPKKTPATPKKTPAVPETTLDVPEKIPTTPDQTPPTQTAGKRPLRRRKAT